MTGKDEELRLVEEAVVWIGKLQSRPDDRTAEEFGNWVTASPLHLSTLMKQTALEDIINAAVKRHRSENAALHVEEQPTPAAAVLPSWLDPRLWSFRGLAASFGAVLLLTGSPWLASEWFDWSIHNTQATVGAVYTLSDGSSVSAYKNSQVRIREFLGRRDVDLARGGAQFNVHPGKWQRFRVESGDTVITAKGTSFNVLRHERNIGVYVAEGSVTVEGRLGVIDLLAGQSADVTDAGRIANKQSLALHFSPSVARTTFLPLSAIAEEFNRRQRVPQIEVVGTAALLPYQSTPSLDDPRSWVRALATDPTFIVDYRDDRAIIRKRSDPSVPR